MVKKIKIVFRLRSLEMGGVNKVLIDILNHLPKEKLDLTILVNLFQGELRNEIPKNIKLIKIAKGKEDFSKNLLIQKLQLIFRALKLKLLHHFSFLMKYYYKENYDIEIAFGRAELEMVLKSPQKNSKKIAWVHWEFSHEPELNQSDLLIERLKQFDHVVFCSDNVRRQVKELYGFEFPSSSVIPNVIHPQEILDKSIEKRDDLPKFNDDLFTFVSVGRVQDNKGYPLLLEIHKKLINQGFFHRIIILGDGVRFNELKQRTKDYHVENSFVLLGNKDNPFPYMKQAVFFILPTQTEAYPLSIKEALILGLPVLATDVGGVDEIISNGIDGILMQYDEEDISKKMKMILTQPDLVISLKNKVEKAKNKFDTFEVYKKIEELLLNLNNAK